MSSADAAALAVIVMVPLLVGGRALVRASRGYQFTVAEGATVVAIVLIGVVVVVLTRFPGLVLALPIGLVVFGLLILGLERREAPANCAELFAA